MFDKISPQALFPSTIWVHDVKPEVAGPLNARLIDELDRLLAAKPARAPGETWQTEASLHERPAFKELADIMRAAAKSVLDRLDVQYGPFEITGCWANVNPKGGIHPAHNHPNNYLSGVYYLQIPDGADAIQFHDPRPQGMMIWPRVKNYNQYNSIVANVRVRAGQLIVFPSWLVHSVHPIPNQAVRISVSFNIMFSDYVENIARPKWDGIRLPQTEDAPGE